MKFLFSSKFNQSIFILGFAVVTQLASAQPQKVTADFALDKIMSNPDWMGNSPERPVWSLDNETIYYQQKAKGHSHRETNVLNLREGSQLKEGINWDEKQSFKNSVLTSKEHLLKAASAKSMLNSSKTKGVFIYHGDLYQLNRSNDVITRLTNDKQTQSSVSFVNDDLISYFIQRDIFLMDLNSHLVTQLASFKMIDDPDKKKDKDYLQQSQPRILEYIANQQKEREFQKALKKEQTPNPEIMWYLGDKKTIKTFRLSPNAKWLILGLTDKKLTGQSDNMPEFVTESGYVNNRKVRSHVGQDKPRNETFYLVDFVKHEKTKIDLSNLPGISDDPLASLRKNAAKKIGYKYKALKGDRAVYAYNWHINQGVAWSDDSQTAAMMLFSYDNKDRWIVTFNTKKKDTQTAHWLSDEAWVNDWTFNEFGWLPDNQTLYYLSEEDGYSHLYVKKGKRRASQITKGKFEVNQLTVSEDGQKIYYRANQKHPGIYEIYRANLNSRSSQEMTDLGGNNDYLLSPDEKNMVVIHSSLTKKPELFLKSVEEPKRTAQQITYTMSREFLSRPWQAPEIKAIKSSHVDQSIYSRLYKPLETNTSSEDNQNSKKRPAVMFVHGAGYLQNSHQGWSGYFREFMFHNYLTSKGYVVLDMDFRASKGYGRDWRTAIYRQMGTPELQDLQDGAKWLVDNMNVDANRIGVYGGSYGGFMTFMAMFKEPELFAAGAALRPVTDWAHYNHGYTSNILNTPEVDPDAYEKSSPIEFASGLNKPLLICHGMIDDNVFFKDSVRLVQKLIELKKTKYFETAIYPVEPHGFKEPSSWLDEYTRIDLLFDRHLR